MSRKVHMALFDEKPEEVEEVEEVQNYKIGEEEFTQEQLEELVGFGKLAKEADERYNTKFDKVYPAFTKSTQLNKEYETQIADYKKQLEDQAQQPLGDDEDQIRQAKDAARKLGLLTKEDMEGYVTKDKFGTQYSEIRRAEKLLDEMDSFAKEADGKDGRPKFDTEEMISYMNESGIQDFKAAYKIKYEKEIDSWKESQLGKAKKPGLYTENSSTMGTKEPQENKITRDNLQDSMRQALEGRL